MNSGRSKAGEEEVTKAVAASEGEEQKQQQQQEQISKSILSGAMMGDLTRNGGQAQNSNEQQDTVDATMLPPPTFTSSSSSSSSSFVTDTDSSSRTQAVVASFFKNSLRELSHDPAWLELLESSSQAAQAEAQDAAVAAATSARSNNHDDDNSTALAMAIKRNHRRKQQQTMLLEKAFNVIDVSQTGYLTSSDLFIFFQQAAMHIGLHNVEDELIDIAVDALLEDITTAATEAEVAAVTTTTPMTNTSTNQKEDGAAPAPAADEQRHITKEQFFDIFHRHPDLMTVFGDDMTRSTLAYYDSNKPQNVNENEINDDDNEQEWQDNAQVWHRYHTNLQNRAVEYSWLLMYIIGTIAIFVNKAMEYAYRQDALDVFGYCILPARGAAACINMNCLLILLPICRHLTTWIQCTPLSLYLPFNAYIEAHILFGTAILIWAMIHVGAHVCDFYRFAHASEDAIYVLFGNKLGVVPVDPMARVKLLLKQPAAITGIIMVICILIAYPVVLVRRNKFNTFWILHHLLLVMLIVLCCHGIGSLLEPYQSVYYVIGPLIIYVASRVLRETKLSDTNILLAQTKSGGIVHLQLKKPCGWKHVRSGMYAFLKVPHISNIEWHPFTLTSTPDDPFLEFHFACVGDWTDAVQSYLIEQIQAAKQENGGEEGDGGGGGGGGTAISLENVQFKVDGPMGASSQGFMDFEVVVLVGAGIGITPMVSVVKYLLQHPGLMQKTYFYWTVRDYKAFEWFSQMLDDIYEKDAHGRLDIYHFLTSLKVDKRDFGAVLLAHAAESKHKRTNFDILIGNRTRHQIEAGRPDWAKELRKIKSYAQELGLSNCGIFLCGPDAMAKDIYEKTLEISAEQRRNKDDSFHFHFTKETF